MQVPLDHTLLQLEKGAILKALARVGGNQYMPAGMLGLGGKTLFRRLATYRSLQGQFGLIFPSFIPLPYQNDPNFHVPSFISGQSDLPRLSLCIRRASPRRVYRVWRLGVTYFPRPLLCLVRCLLKSKESINLAYRGYGSGVPSGVLRV